MTPPHRYELPITTALELPGTVVRENLGIAFGLVVRSMGLAKNFTAAFTSLRKGEVAQYTELLEDARRHAIDRMVANAQLLGANAILSMRFDSSEMAQQLRGEGPAARRGRGLRPRRRGRPVALMLCDADRDALAQALGRHYAEGRMDAAELERRLALVYGDEPREALGGPAAL